MGGLKKRDGTAIRLGFNKNTIYMDKLYPKDEATIKAEEERLATIYDYSKTCCKGQLPCLKECTNNNDINLCYSMILRRYEEYKKNPNLDPKDLGITKQYYDYYMKEFAKLANKEDGTTDK